MSPCRCLVKIRSLTYILNLAAIQVFVYLWPMVTKHFAGSFIFPIQMYILVYNINAHGLLCHWDLYSELSSNILFLIYVYNTYTICYRNFHNLQEDVTRCHVYVRELLCHCVTESFRPPPTPEHHTSPSHVGQGVDGDLKKFQTPTHPWTSYTTKSFWSEGGWGSKKF